jgi:hypothetical protein
LCLGCCHDCYPLGCRAGSWLLSQHKEVDGRDKPAGDCFQRCRNTAV